MLNKLLSKFKDKVFESTENLYEFYLSLVKKNYMSEKDRKKELGKDDYKAIHNFVWQRKFGYTFKNRPNAMSPDRYGSGFNDLNKFDPKGEISGEFTDDTCTIKIKSKFGNTTYTITTNDNSFEYANGDALCDLFHPIAKELYSCKYKSWHEKKYQNDAKQGYPKNALVKKNA